MAQTPTTTFYLKERGQLTAEVFEGTFETKNYLTHREDLARDRIRRELLAGTDMDKADARAASIANAVSELRVRLAKWPKWFENADFGLDLADDNIMLKLMEEVNKAEIEHFKRLRQTSEEAKEELKDSPPNP
jgi:hypothetical protein